MNKKWETIYQGSIKIPFRFMKSPFYVYQKMTFSYLKDKYQASPRHVRQERMYRSPFFDEVFSNNCFSSVTNWGMVDKLLYRQEKMCLVY